MNYLGGRTQSERHQLLGYNLEDVLAYDDLFGTEGHNDFTRPGECGPVHVNEISHVAHVTLRHFRLQHDGLTTWTRIQQILIDFKLIPGKNLARNFYFLGI